MSDSGIAAVVLAAGRSTRLPGNKLLQSLGDTPIVRQTVEAVLASRASPIIVVTGNEASRVQQALAGLNVLFVDNVGYTDGLSSSLKCGLRNVPAECGGAIIALGDMPFVTTHTYDSLISAFAPGREICVPVHRGRRGNPVLWGRRFFGEMLQLAGDKGAKHLMTLHPDLVTEVEVPDGAILVDIDTPDDLSRLS